MQPNRFQPWLDWLTSTEVAHPDFIARFGLQSFRHSVETVWGSESAPIIADEDILFLETNRMFALLWIEMASTWMLNNSEINLEAAANFSVDTLADENFRLSMVLTALGALIETDQLPEHVKALQEYLERCRF